MYRIGRLMKANPTCYSLGAFAFAQLFLKEAKEGTLIFTGATACEAIVLRPLAVNVLTRPEYSC